jgi:hypothetical protein
MSVPDIQWQGPLIIKEGGTYTGNYKSTDSATPAVWIWTEQPVTITGCIIACAGNGIHFETRGQATVRNNKIYGLPPSGDRVRGRGVYCFKPQSAVVEHNYFEGTGGGVMLDQSDATPPKKMKIRYNKFLNMDKRKANPNDTNGIEHRAGIMFSSLNNLVDAEICWNELVNEPGNSWVEDNMLNSGGTQASPVLIHDNYIFGAYPFPLNADSYTGSGLTLDGNPSNNTLDTASKFVNAYNNQIISTCNACANIAAGHDIHFYNNTMISSGMYPDGTPSERFWGAMCVYDGSNVGASVFINNSIENNTIGYVRKGVNTPFPDRQDYVRDSKTPAYVDYTKNTFLPNPITLETEKAEFPKWQKKLADNKIVVGPGTNGVVAIPATPNKIKVGQNAVIKIQPVNQSKANVAAKSVTVQLNGGVVTQGPDIYTQNFKAVTAGKYTGTVTIISLAGKSITKTFDVEILPADVIAPLPDNEAVDFTITFTVS